MISETAQLMTELLLKDQLSSGVTSAESKLGGLNATAGKTGAATAVASSGLARVEGAAKKVGGAMSHAAGQISGLITNLGLFGGAAGLLGIAGAATAAVSKVEAVGNAAYSLSLKTGQSIESMSALLAVTGKVGIAESNVSSIAGMYEKMVGKLQMTVASSAKVQASANTVSLETKKLKLEEVGASVKVIDKLIAESKARDALAAGTVAAGNKLVALQKTYSVILTDSAGKALPFSVALLNVADAYSKATSAADKARVAALASQVFGRGYQTLTPYLALGRQGILDAQAEAAQMGEVLTAQNVKQLADLRATQRTWNTTLSGLEIQAGLTIIPMLTDIGNAANKYLGDPTNRASLLGALKSVENIAVQVGGAIVTIGSAIASIWGKIPGPLQQILIGGFVANKAAGWLFGTSLVGAGKGLLGGLLGSVLGKVPGVGAAADTALGVTHVWVDNMGAGGLGGGGVPGQVAGAAEAAGGGMAVGNTGAMLTGGAVVAGGLLSAGAVAAVAGVAIDQYTQRSNQGDALATQAADFVKTASMADLLRGQAAVLQGVKDLEAQSGYNPLAAAGEGGLGKAGQIIAAEILKRTESVSTDPAVLAQQRRDALGAQDLTPMPGLTAINQLSGGLSAQLAGGHVGAAGVGYAASLVKVFTQSTAPSLRSMDSALGQMKTLYQRYLAQGDTKLAASIGSDIRALSSRVDAVTAAVNAKQFLVSTIGGTTFGNFLGIPAPALHVTTTVSARQNTHATTMQGRYGPVSAGGQAVL